MSNLVTKHLHCQQELVDARLVGHLVLEMLLLETKHFWMGMFPQWRASQRMQNENGKSFLCKWRAMPKIVLISLLLNIVVWSYSYNNGMFCLMQCYGVSSTDTASRHWKRTHESVNEMRGKHVSAVVSLVRNACGNNEQHDAEIDSARIAAEQDVANSSEDIIQYFDGVSEQERGSISGILTAVGAHASTLEILLEDHSGQAASINEKAQETFQQRCMDYEPSGTTPTRCEPDIPSKGPIELLQAMPMEALLEEFLENHSYESFEVKEL